MAAVDKDPKIEEVDSDDSSDEAPDLVDTEKAKQNRSEKKSRKAVQKLGMKQVQGITKVTVRKSRNILFVIQKPDVYKAPTSDTYVVFGEAKVEDLAAQQAQALSALNAGSMGSMKAAMKGADKIEEETKEDLEKEEEEEAKVEDVNVEEKDIELVITQTGCTRQKAIEALAKNNNDIVEAIMSFNQ